MHLFETRPMDTALIRSSQSLGWRSFRLEQLFVNRASLRERRSVAKAAAAVAADATATSFQPDDDSNSTAQLSSCKTSWVILLTFHPFILSLSLSLSLFSLASRPSKACCNNSSFNFVGYSLVK
jgi:hypothetical protein